MREEGPGEDRYMHVEHLDVYLVLLTFLKMGGLGRGGPNGGTSSLAVTDT